MKRKRKPHRDGDLNPRKKPKAETHVNGSIQCPDAIEHPVLSRYYAKVLTLRDYLLARLPSTSKRRRRLLQVLGEIQNTRLVRKTVFPSLVSQEKYSGTIALLDRVLVGVRDGQIKPEEEDDAERSRDLQAFSQQLDSSESGKRSQIGGHGVSLPEIVDFAVWRLFNRIHAHHHKPPHVLCYGILRASHTWQSEGQIVACGIPGLVQTFPNEHVTNLKSSDWASIYQLMGQGSEKIMHDLLVECGIFMPLDKGSGTYYQLSGHVLSELKPLQDVKGNSTLKCGSNRPQSAAENSSRLVRAKSDIRLVRSRMLYARAALNAKHEVAFGLRHIHVLNRYSDPTDACHTGHVMKYIFPRQFGLHNVFTSKTDPTVTSQPFQDYTLREKEIAQAELSRKVKKSGQSSREIAFHLPKRLRGKAVELVRTLQRRHKQCSYTRLLAHYCPFPDSDGCLPPLRSSNQAASNHGEHTDFTSVATSAAHVSAFCRAVVTKVFPFEFLGKQEDTRKALHRSIDTFVRARRFESLTLDTIVQGMKIREIEWLRPPHLAKDKKMALSDFQKRQEVFAELIYYVFDSFLIPLIRTNFHVTESSVHRNRLFYFRHDVWRRLTEPTLNNLKLSMFDEIGGTKALNPLDKHTLGFSQIRLLPKEKGMRPITNLRRRAQVVQYGRKILGRSINSALAPAFTVLNYEKAHQSTQLGASLFSVAGMYGKLRTFREELTRQGQTYQKLFFAKVDVKGCFDSIPQSKMKDLVERLLSANEYRISRLVEVKPPEFHNAISDGQTANPTRKFSAQAQVGTGLESFETLLGQLDRSCRPNTVFIDSVVPQKVTKKQILKLLNEHVENNIVKIGKKYFRQKQGIPQGSVVSSLLCNFFYGDLELNHLGFLRERESVLFRLIDDFLLITTDEKQAHEFLQVMHAGIPAYGVSIKPEKSLVNFNVAIQGRKVPRLAKGRKFPYCGMLIDGQSLDIGKDKANLRRGNVADSLTVEYSKRPGQNFRRKTLSALKIQMHTMLLDTSHNAKVTVLENHYQNMVEVAVKALHYMKCLGGFQQPSLSVLTRTVDELCALAFAMMRSKRNVERCSQYKCALSKPVTQWITLRAFEAVFRRKQTKFGPFLTWLTEGIVGLRSACKHDLGRLERVASVVDKRAMQP